MNAGLAGPAGFGGICFLHWLGAAAGLCVSVRCAEHKQYTHMLHGAFVLLTRCQTAPSLGACCAVLAVQSICLRPYHSSTVRCMCGGVAAAALLGPGVGVEAVQAVVAAYPTPISLHRAYEACMRAALATPGSNATGAAQAMLTELQLASGQRLGPNKSRIVYERLFMNGWDVAAAR